MNVKRLIGAGLIGLAITTSIPAISAAQNLRVLSGSTARSLNVAINRAVVVESDSTFAELSVANPQIADIATLSDRTIYVLGKAPGRTTLTLLGPDGRLITNIDVHVAPDIAEFKERLRELFPGEKIEIRTANDGIVMSGVVSSIAKLDKAIELAERYAPGRVSNLLTVGGTQQVMLKVRFAEMNRSVTKALSSSLRIADAGGDGFATGFTTPGGVQGRTGAFTLGLNSGSLTAAITIEALESKGLLRTLAEPNLVALSGQEAAFLAGGEVPIPAAQDEDTITVEFRPFGVELKFLPTVVDGDIINLRLDTAVSSIDEGASFVSDNFTIPGFSVRSSSTTVELRDGESFAIAGLLEDEFASTIGQVPWLGDLPVLGALFRSSNYRREQSELVVIVTAHLVTPKRGEAYVLSTDRIRPPSESEFFIDGRLIAGSGTAVGEVARQDFSGSYGYVVE